MFWQLGESIALKIISSLLDLCLICPVSQRCVGESQLAESSLGSTTELQFLSNTGNIQFFIQEPSQPFACYVSPIKRWWRLALLSISGENSAN